MSTHARQTIREAVAAALAHKTDAQDRVFPSRKDPWRKAELPGISVDALEESVIREQSTLSGALARVLTVSVTAVVSLEERDGNELDSVALQVETAMHADPTFGGAVLSSILTSTNLDLSDAEGRPVGAVRLTYDVRYHTPAPA